MLYELTQIQERLDEQFKPLEPMLEGFRLVGSSVSKKDLESVENKLQIVLPEEFRQLILEYEFGKLTIGPIVFCNDGDYLTWLVERNRDDHLQQHAWWSGNRPPSLILVANSDPYAIIYDTASCIVYAFPHGEPHDRAVRIAKSLLLFVRGVSTAFLARAENGVNTELAQEIAFETDSDADFWLWLCE